MEQQATSEQTIQRAVFAHLRARAAPGTFCFHLPRGVLCIKDGTTYALEFLPEGEHATVEQVLTADAMARAGAHAMIVAGVDRALAWLEAWGILRGRVAA